MGKGVTMESEVKQGNDMIDESVKQGVSQFVYSSVERGGDEASWNNTTPIPRMASSSINRSGSGRLTLAQISKASTTSSTTSRTPPAARWAGPFSDR